MTNRTSVLPKGQLVKMALVALSILVTLSVKASAGERSTPPPLRAGWTVEVSRAISTQLVTTESDGGKRVFLGLAGSGGAGIFLMPRFAVLGRVKSAVHFAQELSSITTFVGIAGQLWLSDYVVASAGVGRSEFIAIRSDGFVGDHVGHEFTLRIGYALFVRRRHTLRLALEGTRASIASERIPSATLGLEWQVF